MTKSKILAEALLKLSQSKNGEKAINKFFDFIQEKNFSGFLPQIKKHIERQGCISAQEKNLIISTKYELSKEEIEEVKKLVGAEKDSVVEVIIDKNIIGGFSATYKGNIYDGSLRNKISQMKTALKV